MKKTIFAIAISTVLLCSCGTTGTNSETKESDSTSVSVDTTCVGTTSVDTIQ